MTDACSPAENAFKPLHCPFCSSTRLAVDPDHAVEVKP